MARQDLRRSGDDLPRTVGAFFQHVPCLKGFFLLA
jgi:hypothetical protein